MRISSLRVPHAANDVCVTRPDTPVKAARVARIAPADTMPCASAAQGSYPCASACHSSLALPKPPSTTASSDKLSDRGDCVFELLITAGGCASICTALQVGLLRRHALCCLVSTGGCVAGARADRELKTAAVGAEFVKARLLWQISSILTASSIVACSTMAPARKSGVQTVERHRSKVASEAGAMASVNPTKFNKLLIGARNVVQHRSLVNFDFVDAESDRNYKIAEE
eukprot:2386-Heterococcus_DN1.PRE.14